MRDVMAEVKEHIRKLGTDNYYAWSCQVEAVLDSKDLWEAVDDGWTEQELEEDCTEDERKANKKALAFIKRHVENIHLESIGSIKSAKEAWDTLKTNFTVKDEYQQLLMMKALLRMEKDNKTPVAEYVTQVVTVHRELSESGLVEFSSRTVALIVLMGLPNAYKDCVRVLTRDPNLSIKTLIPTLKAEETKIGMDRESRQAKAELRGLVSKKNNQFFPNNNNHQTFTNINSDANSRECHACRQRDHFVRDCPRVLDAKRRGNCICYSCGQEGHSSRFCPKNTDSVNQSGPSASVNREGRESNKTSSDKVVKVGNKSVKFKGLMGVIREGEEECNPCRWALDSGCNAHMTPFKEFLGNFKPVSGTMSVAKKSETCLVKGIGTVTMQVSDECGGWIRDDGGWKDGLGGK